MKSRSLSLPTLAAAIVILLNLSAFGQSLARMNQLPWNGADFVTTLDDPILENAGHVSNSNYDERVELWDSYGRVRLNRNDPESPFLGYRILTSDMYTQSPLIHSTMDEFDLAAGFHIGTFDNWKISAMLGAGYSGTHPFVNEKGVFGIGDITAEHPINDQNSLLLAVDYAGNGDLLPDVPLPGFALMHHDDRLSFMLGFPVNRLEWRPIPALKFNAEYTVPYTGSINAEYLPWQHFGMYANAANFCQGFVIGGENSIDRQFFQMRRVETGLRVVFNPLVDAGIGIGYAFDQTFSRGYDVRSMDAVAHFSNEPYLTLVLHGRF